MGYLKSTLPKLSGIDETSVILAPKERARVMRGVEAGIGKKPTDPGALKVWQEQRSKRYAEAIKKEADRLGLVQHKDIRNEMIDLSFEWRPVGEGLADPNYLSYRSSSKELYADFVSALLNNPGYVKDKAPKTYELFFEYIDRKPEFKKQYLFMEQIMQGRPADLAEMRLEDRRNMFATGDSLREQFEREAKERSVSIWKTLRQAFDDKYFPILDKLNKAKREGAVPKNETAHLLQEMDLWTNEAYQMTKKIDAEVIAKLEKAGVTQFDFGDFLYLTRVIGRDGLSKSDVSSL
jgi:hypothetical protein